MNKIYLVTGATGFVGNNIVKMLEHENKQVIVLARSSQKAAVALKDTSAHIIYGDICDYDSFEKMFEAADKLNVDGSQLILIHTASVVLIGGTKKQYADMAHTNRIGVQNAITACLKHNCRLVYVSSVHAITEQKNRATIYETQNFDPKSVVGNYAKSKAEASSLVYNAITNDGLDAVMVHPSGISGPNDFSNTHLTQLVIDYMEKRIPAATTGGYDIVDVRDVAAATIVAADTAKNGSCYLLTNKFYSVREILDTLYELTKIKKIKTTLPIFFARLGLPFLLLYSKIAKKRPLYTSYSLYTLNSNSNFSHQKAESELGFKPRSLKETFNDTITFLQNK